MFKRNERKIEEKKSNNNKGGDRIKGIKMGRFMVQVFIQVVGFSKMQVNNQVETTNEKKVTNNVPLANLLQNTSSLSKQNNNNKRQQ